LGARFDAWHEYFKPEAWWTALEEAELALDFYTRRSRALDETLPWDHIDVGVRKQYLIQDYLMSQQGETRQDCRERCFNCGILSTFAKLRREAPDKAWQCPPVKAETKQPETIQSQQLRGGQAAPLVSV
jgi:hypothetical protein